MKCPVCRQHCSSMLSKRLAQNYLALKVPIHVRYWRRFSRLVWGWPPVGWSR